MWLFFAFLAVPLIEIGLFIQVGGWIGLWPTLLIVVLTAIAGTALVRSQGAKALGDMRQSFSELSDPTEHLAHGAMILVSGALLLTPGFFTDAVGFALLVPGVRLFVMRKLRERIKVQSFTMGQGAPGDMHRRRPDDRVIDGEYEEVPPRKNPTHEPSGWTKH
ncbi:FxsA family protein [Flavimaricola marinus]|uniref:Phage T7 F exclusion suppressor FxsA n=1 Tax=Flavimaricola marinus TaxID=1819565 RepID=A0A238LE43_9RHOB|nr:FxsA family protein [Flavimaricola marinus]SMY07200.1 phage T7 F exclusion suppressor FxsA [Flavimaricola marinus]